MRLTAHNGRAGKNGAYSAKHNDRNFDVRKADHIDTDRSADNRYWCCYKDMTFEDAEARYYERHFRDVLDARNERYIAQRHPERVRTMDDYRTSEKTCPEETITQIGAKGDTVDPKTLWAVVIEHIRWQQKQYPNVKLLDVALHVDEEGAPHIHERKVWVAHDKDGHETVGQAKALAEMGIDAPDPSKKCGKYNNSKMTYTAECREHLFEVAKEHGLDLEREPKERSMSGLSLEEYKARQEEERARQAQQELKQAQEQIRLQQAELARISSEMEQVRENTSKAEKALKTAQNSLKQIDSKQGELDGINAQIRTARKELKTTLDMKARASEIHKIFGDRETQTYHINMLESTRAIGSEAYDHMKQASSKLQEVAKRETAVQKKEQEIEPLHKAAAEDRQQAKKYLKEQESYILGTADNLAQEKFDTFIQQEFGQKLKGKDARLEDFCDGIKLKDGRTVLEAFEDQEQERRQRLARSWDSWDLER